MPDGIDAGASSALMSVCPRCERLFAPTAKYCAVDGSELGASATAAPTALVDSRYRVSRRLGRGGAGEVWLAHDVRLPRLVAVKRVVSSGNASELGIARLRREAANAAVLDDVHLVRVTDVVTWESGPAVVMDYVAGPTLDELTRLYGPLPVALTAEVVRQIAVGLETMHAAGFVHRDIKPANIVVEISSEAPCRARILDFGIARSFHDPAESITHQGSYSGTLKYMAPEQMLTHRVDHRADVFALAALTCHLLAGGLPDRAPGVTLTRRLIPGAREWPYALGSVLDAALAPDPAQRTDSAVRFAAELVRSVAQLNGSEPLQPPPRPRDTSGLPSAITVTYASEGKV